MPSGQRAVSNAAEPRVLCDEPEIFEDISRASWGSRPMIAAAPLGLLHDILASDLMRELHGSS